MRSLSANVVVVVSILDIFLAGCHSEPTPEERQADSTLVLAKTQLDRGNFRLGRTLLRSALSLDLRMDRTRQVAEEYALLGHLSILSADFDSAFSQLGRAIGQYKSLTDRSSARALLLEVAALHRQMGEERSAYSMYTEARRLAELFKDVDGTREIQLALLASCRALGRTEEEAQIIGELLKSSNDAGNTGMQAQLHFESALSLIHRSKHQTAIEPLLQALTLANQARDSLLIIRVLATLAATYDRVGNRELSFETYTDALTRSDHTTDAADIRLEMLIRVGNIYLRSSHFAEAARFYRAALSAAVALKNKLAEGYTFALLGNCFRGQGQLDDAIKSVQNAMDVFTPAAYSRGLAYANIQLAMVYQQSGRLNDALPLFKRAVEEREWSTGSPADLFLECEEITLNRLTYYDPLIETLLKLGRTDDAFWYAERKYQRILFDEFNAIDIHTRSNDVNTLLYHLQHARALNVGAEDQLERELAGGTQDRLLQEEVTAQIEKAEKNFGKTASAIISNNPRFEPAVQYNGVAITDVQKQLPQGTVLLRHVLTNRSVYVFAISNSKTVVQLAATDREQLLSLVAAFSGAIRELTALADSPAVQRKPIEQRMQDLSAQLYASLIRPVESALTEATAVLVVPPDELVEVPFQALRKGGSRSAFCIEQFPITYLPSLAFLKFSSSPPTPVRDVVAVGHPGMTRWDVEYDLKDIRAFYKDARLWFDQQASLATLQHEHGQVLHLAMDFRFSPDEPGNASVILSDGKTRGSAKEIALGELLTAAVFPTVIASHLGADSVSTGRLLPALFLINGSNAFIINEHPVSRKAKKQFGEMMYTTLLAGKVMNDAFREAIVGLLRNKDSSAPNVWAPFSLWGK